jgi:hypothetical protein
VPPPAARAELVSGNQLRLILFVTQCAAAVAAAAEQRIACVS